MVDIDINEEETAAKAREFLEVDLPKLASLADRDVTSLSSPQLSFSCSHGHSKSSDDILIDHWSADVALVAVHAAAHHIPNLNNQRDVFILTYFKGWTEKELSIKLGISRSTITRYKKSALVEFAQRLDVQKRKPQHQCDWLESLLVSHN